MALDDRAQQLVDVAVRSSVGAAVALQLGRHVGPLRDLVPGDEHPPVRVTARVPGEERTQRRPVVTGHAAARAVQLVVEAGREGREVLLALGVEGGRQPVELREALRVAPGVLARPVGAVSVEVGGHRVVPLVPLVAADEEPCRTVSGADGGDGRQGVLVGPDPDESRLPAVAAVEGRVRAVRRREVAQVALDGRLGEQRRRRLVGQPEVEVVPGGLSGVHGTDQHVEALVLGVGGGRLARGARSLPVHGEAAQAGGDRAVDVVGDLVRVVLGEEGRRHVGLHVAGIQARRIAPAGRDGRRERQRRLAEGVARAE